jgi:hypothetical protein
MLGNIGNVNISVNIGNVGRAFQMHLPNGSFYESAFSAPNVNWTFTEAKNPGSTVEYEVTKDNKKKIFNVFQSGDIKQFAFEYEYVRFSLGWGTAQYMPDNPYVREDLYLMGLRPETMIGCALDFLIGPSPTMKAMFKNEIAVMGDMRPLKIGIQIWVGGGSGSEDLERTHSVSLEQVSSFFDCALEIEQSRRSSTQKVIWYFLSDSPQLRQLVKKKHGKKVTGDKSFAIRHVWGVGLPFF